MPLAEFLVLAPAEPASCQPSRHWLGWRRGRRLSPGHPGAPARLSLCPGAAVDALLVLGTQAKRQFQEGCCLREKCVLAPCHTARCPRGRRKLPVASDCRFGS